MGRFPVEALSRFIDMKEFWLLAAGTAEQIIQSVQLHLRDRGVTVFTIA